MAILIFITPLAPSRAQLPQPDSEPGRLRLQHADTQSLERFIKEYMLPPSNQVSKLPYLYTIRNRSLQLGYQRGYAAALEEIGAALLDMGRNDSAKILISASLKLPAFDAYTVGNAHINLAIIYEEEGRYEQSFKHFQAAMRSGDRNVASTALHNLIGILIRLKRTDEALNYLAQQHQQAIEWNQPKIRIAAFMTQMSIHYERKEFSKGDSLCEVALGLANNAGFKELYTGMLFNKGMSLVQRGSYIEGERLLKEAMQYLPEMPPGMQHSLHVEYGYALLQMGKYTSAIASLKTGIDLAHKLRIFDISDALHHLAKAYEAAGNYKAATQYYSRHLAIKDSLHRSNEVERFNELEVKYRVATKNEELLAHKLALSQKNELIQRKNSAIALTMAGVLVLLLLLAFWWKRSAMLKQREQQKQNHQREIEKLKATIAGEERERKRLGVELHDNIGSMLTALNLQLATVHWSNRTHFGLANLEPVSHLLHQIMDEVRSSSHNLMPDYLLRDGLIPALQSLTVQLSSKEIHIHFDYDHDWSELDSKTNLTIYRIVQELLNNTIKHANARHARVWLQRSQNARHITVTDNGSGFDPLSQHEGIGLMQIRSRAMALGAEVEISSRISEGTSVHISFQSIL
jgi:signal transduction histidine kinase